jgi:hypothetical protein
MPFALVASACSIRLAKGWAGMAKPAEIDAGQAVYSPMVLHTYDWFVLGLSNHLLWRCPTAELRRLYDRNVSPRHLDIGVGTGYFLDKAKWPVPNPAITLVDLNANSLRAASQRIRRYASQTVLANALEPLPVSRRSAPRASATSFTASRERSPRRRSCSTTFSHALPPALECSGQRSYKAMFHGRGQRKLS